MATVTKPIALDESLHTTETSPRNLADVLDDGLTAIANSYNVTGILPVSNGGTGANNATDAKANIGLGNVPNVTTDNQTPTVTQDSTRTNLATGDTLKTIVGKIKKWFADLGTAAFKNVPSSGNASTSQVVMGNDTRLSDSRNAADVYSWAKASSKPSYSASEISGLGTAATKNSTTSVTQNSSDLVTSGAVWTAIDSLPEPMIFKGSLGTGGTITSLPTASSANIGFTYKVITAGTYASQSAKVGDVFISDGSSWVYIPSADEPSGTVTSVGVSNGGGLTVSGSPVTSSGTITVSHADTSSQESVNNSGRTYIQDITLDTYGHVTGIASATETVTNTDTKVTQTNTTTNADYRILFSENANDTTQTVGARKNTNLKYNPSTGNLQTTKLNGVDVGSSPKFTDTTYESKSAASGGTAVSLVTTGEKYTWNNKQNALTLPLSTANGGTGNSDGYIRTGQKSGTTIGTDATAEGFDNTASGDYAHAEGSNTVASNVGSHAEGYDTTASGNSSHAEGNGTKATAMCSHAEGSGSDASGTYSHAEGAFTTASGNYSHAGGYKTIAGYENQTAIGQHNDNKSTTLFEVGNGTFSARSNAFEVYANGDAVVSGDLSVSGTVTGNAVETTPTSGSSKLVTSGGVYTALDDAKMKKTSQTVASSGWTASSYTSPSGTVYGYKKDVTISGMTASSYIDGDISSGTYTGAWCVESASGKIVIRTATQPASSLTFRLYYQI